MSKQFTIEILPEIRTVLVNYTENFTVAQDLPDLNYDLVEVFSDLPEKHYMVLNFNPAMKITFDDIMTAASMVTRNEEASLTHPNVIETIMVTKIKVLQMAGKGLNSQVFSFAKTHVCDSYEEAMAYIQKQVNQRETAEGTAPRNSR